MRLQDGTDTWVSDVDLLAAEGELTALAQRYVELDQPSAGASASGNSC